MPSNWKCSLSRGGAPLDNQAQISAVHSVSPAFSFCGTSPLAPNMPRPVHHIEFQPSEICPQKFVIFDETESQTRIMFHPTIGQNLSCPQMDFPETPKRENSKEKCGNSLEGSKIASPLIDDLDYIDLLLSIDEEDLGESEEEEISTARTQNYDGCSSPESCCNYVSKGRKLTYPSSFKRSSNGENSHREKKRKEARNKIKVLRGMVPGGDQMNTAAVLDAAVRHLNGLEDKVQKLGLSNLKHFP